MFRSKNIQTGEMEEVMPIYFTKELIEQLAEWSVPVQIKIQIHPNGRAQIHIRYAEEQKNGS